MTDRDIAICARRLSKDFGNRRVLRRINLEIAAGESVGLTGGNGAGKTTLLQCLASAIRPTAGEVRWFGQRVTSSHAARRLIGVVAHETRLYPHLTLRENLIFAARMCRVPQPGRRADQLLQIASLASHADRRPTQISKGMRQRVSVVRALAHEPKILLLDEPFSGLDGQGSQWLEEMISNLRDHGGTICFASHDEPRTERLADRLYQLQLGRLHELERKPAMGRAGIRLGAHAA